MISNDDNPLVVPALDIVPAYRYAQRNVTCVSNVASVSLQLLTLSNRGEYFAIANQCIIILRALTRMKFSVLYYHSNDDVSAQSGSDSDSLETVEKVDFVEFLDNNSSMLAGSEADLDTYVCK